MTGKLRILLLLLIILIVWKGYQYFTVPLENLDSSAVFANNKLDNVNKIKVTVYYEALCSDSRNFILKQLVPAYDELHDFIELDLVPYGKAKTIEQDGEITFQCQHAATECLANKIHACGLAQIADPSVQLKYVACMINDNMIPHEIGEKCAQELGLIYDLISECANGEKGSLLLKGYGIRTHAVSPSISFIPTIELDGSQKVPLVRVLKNLKKELCNLYNSKPKPCL